MRIKHQEYSNYLSSLIKEIGGKEIYSPLLLNNKTLLFPLADEPNKIFVISLNQSTPIIYLIKSDMFFSSLDNSFLSHYRKTYGRSIIQNISLSQNDNIVYIKLQSTYDEKEYELIAELIPNSPNLLLVEKGIIKSAFFTYKNRPSKIEEKYVENCEFKLQNGDLILTSEIIKSHFQNEIEIRNREKYSEFTKFINNCFIFF